MAQTKNINTSRSVKVRVKNMMYEGFWFGDIESKVYPPVVYYSGKTHDEVFAKIVEAIDKILGYDENVKNIEIGTVGFDSLDAAIVKEGGGYKAFVAIAGNYK